MKKWYASKTLWFAVLWGLIQVAGIFGFAEYAPGEDLIYYVNLGVSVIVAVLRAITKEGIEV